MDYVSQMLGEGFKEATARFSNEASPEQVKDYIDRYKIVRNKGFVTQKDIDKIPNFKALIQIVTDGENFKPNQLKTRQEQGVETVYEDEKFKVLKITTKEASIKLGSPKWCISKRNNNHFNGTYGGCDKYFVIDKNNPKGSRAIVTNGVDNVTFWDYANERISVNAFNDIPWVKPLLERNWNKWLSKKDHTVNEDGSITVRGSVNLISKNLTKIPFIFREVTGYFSCYGNHALTSLKGCPQTVGGNFYCSNNNALTSLEGAPQTVGGNFSCFYNYALTSLKGCPQTVRNFNCSHNPALTSLKDGPKTVVGDFYCYDNHALTSLKDAPQTVGGDFNCSHNRALTSLEGAPQTVRDFFCSYNPALTSLKDAPQTVGGDFNCSHNRALTSLKDAPQTVTGDFYCRDNPNLSPEEIRAYKIKIGKLKESLVEKMLGS